MSSDKSFSLPGEVFEDLFSFRIPDNCAQRNRHDKVGSAPSYLVFPSSVLTSFGLVVLLVVKIKKGGELAVRSEDHVPPLSPVAAIGASPGNVFFTAKADTPVSSVSGLDEDFGFIDKFDRSDSQFF